LFFFFKSKINFFTTCSFCVRILLSFISWHYCFSSEELIVQCLLVFWCFIISSVQLLTWLQISNHNFSISYCVCILILYVHVYWEIFSYFREMITWMLLYLNAFDYFFRATFYSEFEYCSQNVPITDSCIIGLKYADPRIADTLNTFVWECLSLLFQCNFLVRIFKSSNQNFSSLIVVAPCKFINFCSLTFYPKFWKLWIEFSHHWWFQHLVDIKTHWS